jgi:SH3-like domain-containing protein
LGVDNKWVFPTLLLTGILSTSASAQNVPDYARPTQESDAPKIARIVEDVPGPNERVTKNLIRVKATKTPSGYRVPRYVSLKYSASNGRTGPSKNHPVKWHYSRRGLPMIVVAETEAWRKVRDVNGDESWMKKRLLDGKRMVLVRGEITLRAKPRSDARRQATVGKGALLALDNCDAKNWCRVTNLQGHITGYALKSMLWGAEPL